MTNEIIKADFHLHTEYSMDSLSSLSQLLKKARQDGLGKLIITDHNRIDGAKKLHEQYPDFVVIGEEILTTKGEILAFFLTEKVPSHLSPQEAIHRLKDQGAFISLSHPYASLRHGWAEEEMESMLPDLDAIEIFNGRNMNWMNQKAIQFAAEHSLPGTAGSDGHWVKELGRCGLELPFFDSAETLRTAIKKAAIFGKESSQFVRFFSRKAVAVKGIRKLFDHSPSVPD